MKRFEKALTYFVEREVERMGSDTSGGWQILFANGTVICEDATQKRPHVKGFRLVDVTYDDKFATMHFVKSAKVKGQKPQRADVKLAIGSYKVEHQVSGLVDPHADVPDNLPPDPSPERITGGPLVDAESAQDASNAS